MVSDWIKLRDNDSNIIWRNRKNPNLTLVAYSVASVMKEMYNAKPEDLAEEDKNAWEVGAALKGAGLAEYPEIVEGKQKAIESIADLKEMYKKWGLEGLR